jgi:hypothetical protein
MTDETLTDAEMAEVWRRVAVQATAQVEAYEEQLDECERAIAKLQTRSEMVAQVRASDGEAQMKDALDFLLTLPQTAITAIHPTETVEHRPGWRTNIIRGRTFKPDEPGRALEWMDKAQAKGFGLYFYGNELGVELSNTHTKAYENEVTALHYVHADVDDDKSEPDFVKAHTAALARIESYPLPPSLLIDSGNGFGAFWSIVPAVAVTDVNRHALRGVNKMVADALGADPCWNLDRIMRLPFTTNFPSAAKIARGRTAVQARIVRDDRAWCCYAVEDFPHPDPEDLPEATSHSGNAYAAIGRPEIPDVSSFYFARRAELPVWLIARIERDEIPVGSRSEAVFGVAAYLRREGWSDGEIIALVTNNAFAISEHILDQQQRSHVEQAARLIVKLNQHRVQSDGDLFAAALGSD